MEELIGKVHLSLRNGRIEQALDDLYDLCHQHARTHLNEVVGQIAKIKLIASNDRAGILSLEERIRFQAQASSSILLLITEIEANNGITDKQALELQQLENELEQERKKRKETEQRLVKVEQSLEKTVTLPKAPTTKEGYYMEKIEMNIVALSHSVTQEKNYAVVLAEQDGERKLPVIIGAFEAQAIAVSIEGMVPNRPLTHDLTQNIIELLGYTLKEVIVNNLLNGIFYARLILIKKGSVLEVDSRFSDAIALAVRFSVPIYTYSFILDAAGVVLDEDKEPED